jgi:hypothetical protein
MNGVSDTKREERTGPDSLQMAEQLGMVALPVSLVEYVKAGCRTRANTDSRYDCTRKWRGKQHARSKTKGKVTGGCRIALWRRLLAYLLIVDPGWLEAISDASQKPGHHAIDLSA